MTNYFISYDISDDRLRQRIANCLLTHGCKRVQKSVYLAPRFSLKELQRLRTQLQRLTHGKTEPTDSIICIPVPRYVQPDLVWLGDQARLIDPLSDLLAEVL